MTPMTHVALLGWIPFCLVLFGLLPARRAAITAVVGGVLFLPVAGYELQGLPEYNKMFAVAAGVLVGTAAFDPRRLGSFQPRWLDLPVAVWCVCPVASALSNGIGDSLFAAFYGGASLALENIVYWGLPYFLGRIYFRDLDDLRELAIGVFIGGMIYVPLCLFEIRMSPQLHRLIYGFHANRFAQTLRFGGYRPTVFLQHGLAVGMFMASASILGVWLWRGGTRRVAGLPMVLMVPPLLVTTVLVKSTGATALLGVGIGGLFLSRWTRSRVWLIVLILLVPGYMFVRTAGLWSGQPLVGLVSTYVSRERAASVTTRMESEDLFTDKALRRPLFGWSGWNRFQVRNENGSVITIADAMWVIALGQTGFVGLISMTLILLMPGILLARRFPPWTWSTAKVAPAAALAFVALLFMFDCLLNAMINPIYLVSAGALTAVLPRVQLKRRPRPRSAAAQKAPPAGRPAA